MHNKSYLFIFHKKDVKRKGNGIVVIANPCPRQDCITASTRTLEITFLLVRPNKGPIQKQTRKIIRRQWGSNSGQCISNPCATMYAMPTSDGNCIGRVVTLFLRVIGSSLGIVRMQSMFAGRVRVAAKVQGRRCGRAVTDVVVTHR